MQWHSKKTCFFMCCVSGSVCFSGSTYCTRRRTRRAFTLAEAVAALIILAFVGSSVLVVIDRCISSATDSVLRMRAFEIARENMEKLLTSDTVEESVESGSSEMYPEIEWETTVETFYEPITSRMWVQAICSTEYTDSQGEEQKIELTHWLTAVTKQQLLEILAGQEEEEARLAEQVIETLEEAAEYAGVDEATIQQWVENGMLKTEDGYFIKNQLDFYIDNDGNPSVEDRMLQAQEDADLIGPREGQVGRTGESKPGGQDRQRPAVKPEEEVMDGYTAEEIQQMSMEQLMELLLKDR